MTRIDLAKVQLTADVPDQWMAQVIASTTRPNRQLPKSAENEWGELDEHGDLHIVTRADGREIRLKLLPEQWNFIN